MRKPTASARMKRPRARRSASAIVAGGCQTSVSSCWPLEGIGRPWKTGFGVSFVRKRRAGQFAGAKARVAMTLTGRRRRLLSVDVGRLAHPAARFADEGGRVAALLLLLVFDHLLLYE